uniref:Uncharacterized protein n=1 Tax=Panagrolaimus davidi TaxID=227884 RepID=A0A914P4R2_9BILA
MNLVQWVCAAVNVRPSVIMNMDQFCNCAKVVKLMKFFHLMFSAVPPAINNLEIKSCYRSFSLGVDAFIQKAGMSVLEERLKIPGYVLKASQANYANGSIYPEQNGKWRLPEHAKYAISATLKQ